MVDVWNVNKLTEANEVRANIKKTNTDFRISIWNMEYGILNMSVLISCRRQPPFSDITINFWITKTASHRSCSPEQNICNKIEKSRKTGQDKKSLISIFACFLTAIAKFNFWKGDQALSYVSTQIWDFPNISLFPKILKSKVVRQLVRQLVQIVCYTRYHVSFYLWLIISVLQHCKVPKNYDQDCSKCGTPLSVFFIISLNHFIKCSCTLPALV